MRQSTTLERLKTVKNLLPKRAKEEPLRAELYTLEQLLEEAKKLAAIQKISPDSPNPRLLDRVKENEQYLNDVYKKINLGVSEGESFPPAQEWLYDNFHFIEEQVGNIREDLPQHFYQELPALAAGPHAGQPRIYEMAVLVITHTDSRFNIPLIEQYIQSFQEISPLTTGELWGFAIVLRMGLIENLRRLIYNSEEERQARINADELADQILKDPSSFNERRPLLKKQPLSRTDRAFATQLALRLREGGSDTLPVLTALLDRISTEGFHLDDLIRERHQELAGSQLSMSNTMSSLRLLAGTDWSELVENTSLVNDRLLQDPSGFYEKCDFATRDYYRHIVEKISKRSKFSEIEVADDVLALCRSEQVGSTGDARRRHVGYYLTDKGRKKLEAQTHFKPGFFLRIKRFAESHPFSFYQLPIGLLTFFFLFAIFQYCSLSNYAPVWNWTAVALFCLPASALSLTIVNWAVTMLKAPVPLAKLDLKDGIPPEYRTIVVLPTLLTGSQEIRELTDRLEIHYLANSDDLLDFALLTDYVDADSETTPEDEQLLKEMSDLISILNRKYPRSRGPRFHYFHRVRKWNEAEDKWMGWERKRGKLDEFNRMLLGDSNTSFLRANVPDGIQFVITLDSDTILPRDSARKLIGTMAHPLNRGSLDPATRQVIEGYGVLQPRISHTLTSANRTWFSLAFSGSTGIDPYTTAVSDIYQDLFKEASFVGKGIYDLRPFEECVHDRFPENTLLSHDLIEGAYARTGLVSDVEFFDDHPSDYITYAIRLHRWVRGDWQIAGWLGKYVRTSDGSRVRNTLSWLNQWKLFDNLRRSLVSPFTLIGLLAGWTVLPGSPWFWTVFVLAILFSPIVLQLISSAFMRSKKIPWISHLWAVLYEARISLIHSLLKVAFLADEAIVITDAILRTLYRMVRHKQLLEWMTAALAEKSSRGRGVLAYIRRMFLPQILAVVFAVLIVRFSPHSLGAALPFLIAWFILPFIGYYTGRNIPHRQRNVPAQAIPYFRGVARDIWRYYETFVTEQEHWLPPDNFQETPQSKIAHRTSPTNIGFFLLSSISAYDLGYISSTELVDRVERTLATLSRLKTFNGHFYNWYDTRTLTPLEPRYVSTVDSGNLAASLIVLKQFALHFPKKSYPRKEILEGIRDTLLRLLNASEKTFPQALVLRKDLSALQKIPSDLTSREKILDNLQQNIMTIALIPPEESEAEFWWNALQKMLKEHRADRTRPYDLAARLKSIAEEAEVLVEEMNFKFLFHEGTGVFSIGFNVSNGQLDNSFYDLLASEARLTSFIAIAKGDVPQSHWFRLARTMTATGRRILVSWSGSMFEFLMPMLLLKNEANTLLEETTLGAVEVQEAYNKHRNLPWGISEAGYNARDVSMNYQYGPFGVPSLALKRGLDKDLVVAPYATFLGMMVDPAGAFENLRQLEEMGMRGKYGFYESIDFTKDRLPEGAQFAIVQSFMAHHQGMSLVAIDNVIDQDCIQKLFHMDPSVRATELLLQERMPSAVRSVPVQFVSERVEVLSSTEPTVAREFFSYDITPPRTQILSNGNYLVAATTGGSGYSECKGIQVNRWREDVTRDNWGSFIYLKDWETGRLWSAGFQPTLKPPSFYHVTLAEDRVGIGRRDDFIETHLEITVSPEEDAEVRRLNIVNASSEAKEIDIASYLEVVLSPLADDLAHPAFNNLFVETEFVPEMDVLLARRKPRSEGQASFWAAHVMMCDGEVCNELRCETDRRIFIGRGHSIISPQIMDAPHHTNSVGAVLDPIFSLRRKIRIPAFGRAAVAFTTLVAATREDALAAAGKYREPGIVSRTFELSATHSQLLLQQLSITSEEAQAFQRLAGRLLFSDPSLRPGPFVLSSNKRTQSALWPYGISGDLPICVVRVEDSGEIDVVQQMLRAHEYWRLKGYAVDLVIINEFPSSYFQQLQEDLLAEIRSGPSQAMLNKPGGIFLIQADSIPDEDRVLLRTVARVQIVARRGKLARQLARVEAKEEPVPSHVPISMYPIRDPDFEIPVPPLQYANGFGGFSNEGKEYTIVLREGLNTPAPWINVISNSNFGFQISESGAGMTWSENSRENRLTPWSNDPVSDPVDVAIYVRDEESGDFWSISRSPVRGTGTYVVTHGAGYTRFQYGGHGIEQEMLTYTAAEHPVKITKVRLRNQTRRTRWLSVTHYAELTLGVWRGKSAPFIVTLVDEATGALLATNSYNNEFADRLVFSAMNDQKRTVTGDRSSFLGANGSLRNPSAMFADHLSGRVGAGLDPCHASQSKIKLEPFGEHVFLFLMGEGKNLSEVRELINQFDTPEAADAEFRKVQGGWDKILGTLEVQTPDVATNILLNRWLLYQTLSCRFWGRTAFYQSGGAFGFRDQLQDAMALVATAPELLQQHLLRAASHQFPEGDVQHWWHPPTGRGVRTRSSDDLLWLPYAASYYVQTTGDYQILEEEVPFLDGPVLKPEEMETYFRPRESGSTASLYDHCIRAIDCSLKLGEHGLPLIGSGDWNDGMNHIGIRGRGESVWLGWFLIRVLKDFAAICERKCNKQKAANYREMAKNIAKSLESSAWDGAWYIRAFNDDGIAIGTVHADECQIDSIAQSWAVLSDEGNSQRALQSLESAYERLVKHDPKLVLLFQPPFAVSNIEPGYVKSYPPGIRENGGHYTHAGTWLVGAFTELGKGNRAFELFQYLNPILHSLEEKDSDQYRVEPYAVSADIYSSPDRLGMGGWSWYTGSAGWIYRTGIEWILGFRLSGDHFVLRPCIPSEWKSFQLTYHCGKSTYRISVDNPNGKMNGLKYIELDGVRLEGDRVPLNKTEKEHIVKVVM